MISVWDKWWQQGWLFPWLGVSSAPISTHFYHITTLHHIATPTPPYHSNSLLQDHTTYHNANQTKLPHCPTLTKCQSKPEPHNNNTNSTLLQHSHTTTLLNKSSMPTGNIYSKGFTIHLPLETSDWKILSTLCMFPAEVTQPQRHWLWRDKERAY